MYGEACEGSNLDGETCESLGFHGGTLACANDCQAFDETDCAAVGRCGDALVQTAHGETCDGADLDDQTRQTLGWYGGTLTCTDGCTFDESDCADYGRCGDGTLHAAQGEACDGTALNGQTCVGLGFYGGILSCSAGCAFDTTGCAAVGRCGDATVQDAHGEVCDGANLDDQTCLTRGFYGGTLTCAADCGAFDESACAPFGRCGDANVQTAYGEDCDGTNLNGTACINLGYYGGELACTTGCDFDITDCEPFGRCGDATIQTTYGEVCDGALLAGQTCASRGFYGGNLACAANCQAFDESDCVDVGRCGDGLVQTAHGEECDGLNLNSQTCGDFGFYEGTLTCDASCRLIKTACSQTCGDGATQLSYGELCDGDDLNGQSCVTRGYYDGTLVCNPDCLGFNETSCVASGRCGDTLIQPAFGEDCDGANLDAQTCTGLGYYGGTLSCQANCDFNLTNCASFGRCGDNLLQESYGEVCDGNKLAGQTCTDLGYYGGNLACNTDCHSYNEADCALVGRCGDGIVQDIFGEDCDGANLAGASCESLGYYGGILSCGSDCRFALSSCAAAGRCGDDVIQAGNGEICDRSALAGQSCTGMGYYGGDLDCHLDCKSFKLDSCIAAGKCGDNTVQGAYEICDGTDLNGQNCVGMGWYGGTLACEPGCANYNIAGCQAEGWCGDGVIQDGYGEICDGSDFGMMGTVPDSCEARGFYGGYLVCLNDCRQEDESSCIEAGRCGDNTLQALYGEECDGFVPPGASCTDYGYYEGTLSCDGDCNIVTACSGQCNDGTLQNGYEDCDGALLGGQSCSSLGYYGGTLACQAATCDFNLTSCEAAGWCGDGNIQAVEDCDGENLNSTTCRDLGYFNGDLACTLADCQFEESECEDIVSLSAGYYHTCAVLTDGTIRCWGFNNFGQLGNGTDTPSLVPTPVTGISTAVEVSVGYYHTCARLSDGLIKCWGLNNAGQLGINSTDSYRYLPATVYNLTGASEISAGYNHNCARIGEPGSVVCWGAYQSENYGQLGNGSTTGSRSPVAIGGGFTNVISVSAGRFLSCMATSNKQVFCWGYNGYGQVGNGTTNNQTTPQMVQNIGVPSVILSVTAGGYHACALMISGGNVTKCWGLNESGQLGDDTTNNSSTAVTVNLNGANQITAGEFHTCGLFSSLTPRCWGRNTDYQLGDNTNWDRHTPTPVTGGYTGIARISGGFAHTCMYNTGGHSAWCWGLNDNGQMGDGSTTSAAYPVTVSQ